MTRRFVSLVVLLTVLAVAVPAVGAVPAGATTAAPGVNTAGAAPAPNNTTAANATAPNPTNDSTTAAPRIRGGQAADLAVHQPAYVGSDVQRESANGTPRYLVQGAVIDLRPRNFAVGDVVSFGLTSTTGRLTYDPDFGTYRLRPDGPGTYRAYWIVQTASGQVRYTAQVRVTGQANMVHQTRSEFDQTLSDAANWTAFVSAFEKRNLGDPGIDRETEFTQMLNWYELYPTNNPLSALTGGFTSWVIITVSTPGGALGFGLFLAFATALLVAVRKRLHIFETVEGEEGDARAAVADLERRENERIAAKTDPRDVHNDDHVASAIREVFGDNLKDASEEFLRQYQPRALIANRLRAMGLAGWTARRVVTDGGDGGGSVELVKQSTVSDDADTVDLTAVTPDDDLLDALDWAAPALRGFDLAGADYDPSEADVETPEHDLETLVDRFEADMRHFDDGKQYGEYLLELVAAIAEKPLAERDGSINGPWFAGETFLQHAEVMGERFDWPAFPLIHDAIQRALVDYDREEEAQDVVERVRNAEGS